MSSMWKVAHAVCGVKQRDSLQSGYDSLEAGITGVPSHNTLETKLAALEAALAEERRRSQCKEEDLSQARTLLAKLERTVEQQTQVAQLDQQHLAALEAALAKQQQPKQQQQQHHHYHHQAGRSEQHAYEGADQQRAMELEHALTEERQRLVHKEDEIGELRQLVANLEEAMEQTTAKQLIGARTGLTDLSVRAWEKEPEEEHEANIRVSPGEAAWESRADELARRVAELEEQVLDKEVKNVELMQALSQQRQQAETLQHKLTGTEALLERSTQQAAERNDEFEKLQQQLVDEFSKRQRVQMQLLDKARQVCELQESLALEIKLHQEATDAQTLEQPSPLTARPALTQSPKPKVMDGSMTARAPARGSKPPVMQRKERCYSLEAPIAKPGSKSPDVPIQRAIRQGLHRTASFARQPGTAPSELNRSISRAAHSETTSMAEQQVPPVPPLACPVTPVGSVSSNVPWRMVSAPSIKENGTTSKLVKQVSVASLSGAQIRSRAFCAPPPVVQHLGTGSRPPTPTVQRRLMQSSRSFT